MFVEDMVHLGKVRSEIREKYLNMEINVNRKLVQKMYLISVLVIQVFLLRKV